MSMIETYEEHVTDRCYGLLSEITGEYAVSNPEPPVVYESVMLHHYVHGNIADEPRDHGSEPLQTFSETWNGGAGNCEEKSVLLCSLLRQLPDNRTRFITVANDDLEGHALLEIRYTEFDDPERVARLLRVAYKYVDGIDRTAEEIHWETDRGDHWFVVDPVKSEYVGDLSTLVEEGFAHKDGDTWEWHRVKDTGDGRP